MKLGHSFLSDVSRVRHVLDTGTLKRIQHSYDWHILVKCPI